MSSRLPTGTAIEKSWTTVYRVWQVEVAVVVGVWLLLPQLLSPLTGHFESSGLFIILFLGVSLLDLGMAWWMKSRAFAQISQADASSVEEIIGRISGPSLIAVVLPVSPAFFGIVLYLLTGNYAVLTGFCLLSQIGLLLLRPRLEEWQEIVGRTRIDANRRS